MKKLFVSIGLAAAGTASLQATYAPGLDSMQTTKLWSISGTLRGFYDNNYDTQQTDGRGSYGFEVSPSFSLNVPMQQTEFGLRYTYGLYYYQDREELHQNPIDQTHEFDLWLDHAFTERVQGSVLDSFIVGQEPELLTPSSQGPTPVVQRVEGDNIANYATFTLHNDWTRLLSTDLGYKNGFFYYQQHGDGNPIDEGANPSLAGTLNRDENTAWLNLNWQVLPETVALMGVQFDQANYIANEVIGEFGPLYYYSDSRDSRSYTGYLGLQENFLPNLTFAANVGVQYTDYYNDPLNSTTSVSPYAVASLTYTYAPGDYAQIGVNHSRNATYQVDTVASNGSIALDQESTLVFANINHQLTPKLLATAIGQVQLSSYNGGLYNNDVDTFYSIGLNLSYALTPHFSAEAGYNFDDVQSQIPGTEYSRNRVYLGVTAVY